MSPWGNRRKDGQIISLNTYYNSFLVSLCPSVSRQARAWKHLLPSTPPFFCLCSCAAVSPSDSFTQPNERTLTSWPHGSLLPRKARDRMDGIRYLPNEVIKDEFLIKPETGWNNPSVKAHNCSTLLYSNTLQYNSGSALYPWIRVKKDLQVFKWVSTKSPPNPPFKSSIVL